MFRPHPKIIYIEQAYYLLPSRTLSDPRAALIYTAKERSNVYHRRLNGYDWPLPYVPGKTRASGLSNNDAQNLAIAEQSPIQWDRVSASPHFNYMAGTTEHSVWFDDAQSAAIKLSLVDEYGLRGISAWVLGNEFPQLWYLLGDEFTVKKY